MFYISLLVTTKNIGKKKLNNKNKMRKKSKHAPIKIYKSKIIQDGFVDGSYIHPF